MKKLMEDKKTQPAKTDKQLLAGVNRRMMVFVGVSNVIIFVLMIMAFIFIPSLRESRLFVHVMGVVEGILFMVASHYYGNTAINDEK
jgi:hypothetical protein